MSRSTSRNNSVLAEIYGLSKPKTRSSSIPAKHPQTNEAKRINEFSSSLFNLVYQANLHQDQAHSSVSSVASGSAIIYGSKKPLYLRPPSGFDMSFNGLARDQTISSASFYNTDEERIVTPNGHSILINTPMANAVAARMPRESKKSFGYNSAVQAPANVSVQTQTQTPLPLNKYEYIVSKEMQPKTLGSEAFLDTNTKLTTDLSLNQAQPPIQAYFQASVQAQASPLLDKYVTSHKPIVNDKNSPKTSQIQAQPLPTQTIVQALPETESQLQPLLHVYKIDAVENPLVKKLIDKREYKKTNLKYEKPTIPQKESEIVFREAHMRSAPPILVDNRHGRSHKKHKTVEIVINPIEPLVINAHKHEKQPKAQKTVEISANQADFRQELPPLDKKSHENVHKSLYQEPIVPTQQERLLINPQNSQNQEQFIHVHKHSTEKGHKSVDLIEPIKIKSHKLASLIINNNPYAQYPAEPRVLVDNKLEKLQKSHNQAEIMINPARIAPIQLEPAINISHRHEKTSQSQKTIDFIANQEDFTHFRQQLPPLVKNNHEKLHKHHYQEPIVQIIQQEPLVITHKHEKSSHSQKPVDILINQDPFINFRQEPLFLSKHSSEKAHKSHYQELIVPIQQESPALIKHKDEKPRKQNAEPIIYAENQAKELKFIPRSEFKKLNRTVEHPQSHVEDKRRPHLAETLQDVRPIEEWLNYEKKKSQKASHDKPKPARLLPKPKNLFAEWHHPDVEIKREFNFLGVEIARPSEYEAQHNTFYELNNLPYDFLNFKIPDEVLDVYKQASKKPSSVYSQDYHGSAHAKRREQGVQYETKVYNLIGYE